MVGSDPTTRDQGPSQFPIERREFLRGAGAGAGLAALPATASAQDGSPDLSGWSVSRTGRPSGLETDEDGWTVLEKSADTRTVYVSSSEGDDANDGTSRDAPVATLDAGVERLRDGYPDWLCLKSGDVWRDEDLRALAGAKSGRSDTERLVVTSYGDGPRPRIETDNVVNVYNTTWRNLAFVGIECYAYSADPDHPEFDGSAAGTGFRAVQMEDFSNVLWEDCRIHFFGYGFSLSGAEVGDLSAIEFRRCVVTDCWEEGTYDEKEKSQGIWNSSIEGYLIEETLWDHNGYNDDVEGAGRNMYNHNVYMAADNRDVAVRRNVFARGAAHGLQLRAGGLCRNNLFVRNSISVNVGKGGEELHDARVADNVVLEGRMMDPENTDHPRTPALWGIDYAMDSEQVALVEDNLVAHAIHDGGVHKAVPPADQSGLTRRDNVVYDWDEEQDQWSDDWPAPERSVAEYHASIGGDASLAAFLQRARDRGPGEWNPDYAAPAVNDFVRAGFAMDAVSAPEYGSDGSDDDTEIGAPQGLSASDVSVTMVAVEWTAPAADVDHYRVDVNGSFEETTSEPNFVVTGLSAGIEHEVGVRAVDAGGTRSERVSTTFETGPNVPVSYARSSPTVDGTIGDVWSDSSELQVAHRTTGSESGLDAIVQTAWNDDAFYALVTVEDDAVVTDSERDPWEDDTVELFLDADASGGESYDDTDVQYLFRADDDTVYTGPFGLDDATGVEHAYVETDDGYRLEVAIPWSTLGATPETHAEIGFDAHVNDNDGGDTRDAKYALNDLTGTAASTPDRFAPATLQSGEYVGPTEPCQDVDSVEIDGQTVCDVDGDGTYRDVTGDGTVGQSDVVQFFQYQHREAWKQPELFDYSGNGTVGHGDVVELFVHVATS